MDLRIHRSLDLQPDGFGAGRQQQCPVFISLAVLKLDLLLAHVERRHSGTELQIYSPVRVKVRWPQGNPIVWRGTRQEILGEIESIVRRASHLR